jgi:23S rRNA (adenine2503-C2)-methyltransferase
MPLSRAEIERTTAWQSSGLSARVAGRARSADGSVRLLVALHDGETVEAVAMPARVACLSTQVGCAVACRFCASGLTGLRRNLTADEIVEQLILARREMGIDRVLYMGMGEPTHNLAAVLAAVARFRDLAGIGPSRQTVSTVGSPRAFAEMAQAPLRPCLALSLHSADRATRRALLPNAPDEPVDELVLAADAYGRRSGIPLQIEWTLLDGINDQDRDLAQLAVLMRGVRGYVNFIPWNPVSGLPFAPAAPGRAEVMTRGLRAQGIVAAVRWSSAGDVDGACGQLRRRSASTA